MNIFQCNTWFKLHSTYKLCGAVTSVKPPKLAQVMNVFNSFAVAHRTVLWGRSEDVQGLSLQGTRGRTMAQERCFGATEP